MWSKRRWTQGNVVPAPGNVVPAPPVIEIQRSHTSDFMKMLGVHSHLFGGPKLTCSFLTSDVPICQTYSMVTYNLKLESAH